MLDVDGAVEVLEVVLGTDFVDAFRCGLDFVDRFRLGTSWPSALRMNSRRKSRARNRCWVMRFFGLSGLEAGFSGFWEKIILLLRFITLANL